MKIFLGILAVVLVVASLIADYKWRQWMAARRQMAAMDGCASPRPPIVSVAVPNGSSYNKGSGGQESRGLQPE